uniref:TNRC6 PABC binding domain-containing protein n=1 Tax=Astatotilapia calliptera TaxID=8154 RepID=A0AAX7SJR4_ASTCA
MDADSSSSIGSERNLAATTVMMMSANASSSSATSSPTSSLGNAAMMVSVSMNGDGNGNSHQVVGAGMETISSANNGNNMSEPSHYSMAGSNSIGSNNMSNHNNKLVNNGGVWGTPSGSNVIPTGGSTPCINGGLNPNTLNPNANHGAWPQNSIPNPASQGQRPPQAQGIGSKLGMAPQQAPLLGWGGMAAPDNSSMMQDTEVNNGTLSSNSGNGGLKPTNLNTESNGPNNTITMNTTTTTTNATMTSSPPNSTASPQLSGDCSWGSIGGGTGGPLANGNPSSAPQHPQGELGGSGAFGTPWGAATYPVDKGPPNADTVNPQIPSTAAYKSNNNHNNTGAPRWDQGPSNTPNQPQSNLSCGIGSNQILGSTGQTAGNGNQTTMGPPAAIPRPWGSSASLSSSSSSTTPSNNPSDAGSHKGSSSNNGWKSLEDDAMGMGGAVGGSGSHGLGSVTGGWGRSGGSEGSGESSGGRSSSDRESIQTKGGRSRKSPNPASVLSLLVRAEVDPRVLSNTGWGQTPIRQNTAWDVNSPNNNQNQGTRGDERKLSSGSSGWGKTTPAAPSQTSGEKTFQWEDQKLITHSFIRITGWLGGPMPTVGQKEEVSTGWEEPSPESIRRKMEIDDGTAAWGDPGKYSGGSVNMWNRTGQPDQEAVGPSPQHQSHPTHMSMQHVNQDKSSGSGWGEPYPQQKESASWGEPSAAPPVTVDNGTSAWGKPNDKSYSWGDGRDSRESGSGWGSQHKSGPKRMDTWCSDEMGNSWDQEEEVEIGMWSNNQQDSRSHDQHAEVFGFSNVISPDSKNARFMLFRLRNHIFLASFLQRDSPDDSIKTGAGMVQDKRMDMGSIGDFNGVMGKNSGSRHHLHKDSTMDRSSYYDKVWRTSDELSSNQSMSLSPSNSAQSVSCLNSGPSASHSSSGNVNPMLGGNTVAQGRGGPQSQPPPQPSLRNQVPPPILPAQVPSSLLKYPGGNGGLNPLFGPQQMAVLNQLSQLNQINQINQLQQQQQKVQSQRPMPMGRQTEQTRPIGSSPSPMQPPRHMDPSLLKPAAPLKPYLDNYMSHSTPEMLKDAATLGSFSNFPLNLNSNLNVPLDMGVGGGSGGGVSYKEPPQSRLKKLWATDPPEQTSKPGAMSSGLRLEDSSFYDLISPGPSPLSPPGQSMGSVGDGWPPRANSPPPHGNTVTWPPEFRPGEPWKGYPNIDPETDPYVTPGSVINNLSINTVRDTDHLRDRNNGPSSSLNTTMPSNSAWSSIRASSHSGSLTSTAQSTSARPSESKWSPGSSVSNSSLAHELWKVPLPPKALSVAAPSRPPPGLTSQKPSPASSGWDGSALRLGGWSTAESRYTPGSSWGDSSSSGRTQWLVLKNLTPQIDGSTLRTLCMQHGPLITFHLNLPHGNAVVCYSSKDEATKAQKSLHMCVLGNTTILAEFASEEEISRFFAQGQSMATPSSGWQTLGSSQSRMDQSHPFPSRASEPNQWNSSDLHSSSLWGGPNYSSSLWGTPSGTEAGRISSPSPITSFLPVDHLTGGGDSM